jgi:hypothetical protein
MATLPQPIKKRNPQNARLGIKSSLSNLKRVVSLVYLLYLANDRKGKVDYSEEYLDGTTTKIRLKDAYKVFVSAIFAPGEADSAIAANPLITSQLEPLQVGLELVFQLGKINFVARKASSAERTGGSRFAKTITFSKNIVFLDVYFSAIPEAKRKQVLAAWMKNEESGTDADAALYQMLTAFTENLKMSVDDGTVNRTFEQEGLYKELLAGNNVIGKDAHEDVGPLRIYKSFVKEGMHPYVLFESNEFASKVDNDILSNYLLIVSTALDLQNSEIPDEVVVIKAEETTGDCIQKIYYGCPGTGKSHKVKGLTEGYDGEKIVYFDEDGNKVADIESVEDKSKMTTNIFRTTFHPDYDYSTFVGSYKPVMNPVLDDDGNETDNEELAYEFVPQVFTNAYVRAWKSLADTALTDAEKQVYLIIEEINRGNCAQIFGDLFQLLDRKNGRSEFSIIPDAELRKYLAKKGLESHKLVLPANFNILATMNTSDQSLFPMDSAFKRRWAMEYVPIKLDHKIAKEFTFTVNGSVYSWVEFLGKVNPLIRKATDSEDKQMGEFFIKGNVSEEDFKNKVMFYLWNDVCKDLYSASRISPLFFMRNDVSEGNKNVFTFAELYGKGRHNEEDDNYSSPTELLEGFITKYLKLEPKAARAEE